MIVVEKSRLQCAGINRHEAENAKFSRVRSSDPLGPEFCVGYREVHGESAVSQPPPGIRGVPPMSLKAEKGLKQRSPVRVPEEGPESLALSCWRQVLRGSFH